MSGLVISALASAILQALGPPTDKNGAPISVTSEMTAYASAVVDTFHAAVVANASGTVVASGTPSSPITGGAATGGLITTLPSATWQAQLSSGFPSAPSGQLSAEAAVSTTYLKGAARVAFASNKITGTCTAGPTSPGPLANGAGADGTVASISGSAWATAVLAALGTPGPLASAVYTAVAGYLMTNAVAAYASSNVSGAFSAGGGAMTAGTGVAGTIL
jgi:hypothetical protein